MTRTSHIAPIRVSLDELESIKKLAEITGRPVADYMRSAALKQKLAPLPKIPETNLKVYSALGKIGTNLNQIATALNKNQFPEFEKLVEALKQLHLSVAEIRRDLTTMPALEVSSDLKD